MATDPSEVTDYWEDREAAKKLTGVFANRVYVQPISPGMVRVNFGEVLDEEPTYHTAIVLTAADAMSFAALIYQVAQANLPAPPPIVTTPAAGAENNGDA